MPTLKALDRISIQSKLALTIAGAIMFCFLIFKTLLLFKFTGYNEVTNWYEWLSIVFFMPPFFTVVYEFVKKTKVKEDKIDTQLKAIDHSNLVVTLDIDGNIVSCNQKFLDLTLFSKTELVGKHHSFLCDKEYSKSKEYKHFWDRLRKGEFISGTFERKNHKGESIWLFGTYTPLKDSKGNYYRVLKIAVDITSQYKAEILVKQKSIYLEHASKIIRHDMHSGINTYLPRGIKSLKRRLDENQINELKIKAPLQLIEDGLSHARKVYAGVYEFTNLVKQNSQMNVEESDVKQTLNDYLKLTAYKNQVLLDDNLPNDLKINPSLFCTAIDNLIRNGLKYNDSKTKWVKIYQETTSTGKKTICIEDNGRGISQKDLIHLSQPYIRKKSQKEGGTGLGLNICIAILKEHGFILTAKKLKQGTKLTIEL